MIYRRRSLLCAAMLLILAAALFNACSHTRPAAQSAPPPTAPTDSAPPPAAIRVPGGVDSSVAHSATLAAREVVIGWREDSLAQDYYRLGKALIEQGRPLKEVFVKSRTPRQSVPPEDTLKSYDLSLEGQSAIEQGEKALGNKRVAELAPDALAKQPETARRLAAQYLEEARDLLERALRLNPWDEWTRSALIGTYQDLSELHLSFNSLDDAIDAIRHYLELYGDEPTYLHLLAHSYEQQGDTLDALIAYRRAEDALLLWATIPDDVTGAPPAAKLDSAQYALWLDLIARQYQCERSLGLAASAIADLERLFASCRVDADSALRRGAQQELEALKWDDGDLEAMKLRLSVIEKINVGEWEAARLGIMELLQILDNPDARFEVEQWAATIDFRNLGQYEAGLSRMRRLLNERGFAEIDSSLDSLLVRLGRDELIRRMTAQRTARPVKEVELLDIYGSACTTYGREVEDKQHDRERAYVYYYQGALVPWRQQAASFFNLAFLSRNQPDKVILYGEAALAPGLIEPLNSESRVVLFQLLRDAYRRKNDKPHAEYYNDALVALKNGGTQP